MISDDNGALAQWHYEQANRWLEQEPADGASLARAQVHAQLAIAGAQLAQARAAITALHDAAVSMARAVDADERAAAAQESTAALYARALERNAAPVESVPALSGEETEE